MMVVRRKKVEGIGGEKGVVGKREKYEGVDYMVKEWEGVMNMLRRGD